MTELPDILRPLYAERDGGLACERALWVFAAQDVLDRKYAVGVPDGLTPFAADLLGDLFCVEADRIVHYVGEMEEWDHFADDAMDWQHLLMLDPDAVGVGVAREWQQRYGVLPAGRRLTPAMPFVLGGRGGVNDLKAVDLVEILGARSHIARQLRGLPDGARVLIDLAE